MRHHRTFARAAALLLSLCSSSFAQSRCSSDTVRGTWAYQGHGTVMMNVPGSSSPVPVPFTGLGIMKVDYQGLYAVHATISVGGQIQEVEFSGSIQVNPDCTATNSYTSGTLQGADRLTILDNGAEMYSMPTKFPLGPAAGMFHLRRIAWGDWNWNPPCTVDMVRGYYAGPREGTQMVPGASPSQLVPVPFSAIHTATFQNGGTGTAASTASLGGAIVDFEFPSISISVNPDCTATMKYTGASKQFPGQTFTGSVKYIVLNYGSELIGMDTEANTGLPAVVLDNVKRISMAPIVPDR
jgi:hypothetical protein